MESCLGFELSKKIRRLDSNSKEETDEEYLKRKTEEQYEHEGDINLLEKVDLQTIREELKESTRYRKT